MITKFQILDDIKSIIYSSRLNAYKAVNWERTLMYWNIGKRIFEEKNAQSMVHT